MVSQDVGTAERFVAVIAVVKWAGRLHVGVKQSLRLSDERGEGNFRPSLPGSYGVQSVIVLEACRV